MMTPLQQQLGVDSVGVPASPPDTQGQNLNAAEA